MSDLEHELINAERAGWEALATGRAGEHYRQHLAANAIMALPFGVMTRIGFCQLGIDDCGRPLSKRRCDLVSDWMRQTAAHFIPAVNRLHVAQR